MPIEGIVRLDRLTKRLLRRLRPEEIAIIAHRELDELAAKGLLRARVKAVINAYPSISGRYPNRGPERLLQARIPIIDNVGKISLTAWQKETGSPSGALHFPG